MPSVNSFLPDLANSCRSADTDYGCRDGSPARSRLTLCTLAPEPGAVLRLLPGCVPLKRAARTVRPAMIVRPRPRCASSSSSGRAPSSLDPASRFYALVTASSRPGHPLASLPRFPDFATGLHLSGFVPVPLRLPANACTTASLVGGAKHYGHLLVVMPPGPGQPDPGGTRPACANQDLLRLAPPTPALTASLRDHPVLAGVDPIPARQRRARPRFNPPPAACRTDCGVTAHCCWTPARRAAWTRSPM